MYSTAFPVPVTIPFTSPNYAVQHFLFSSNVRHFLYVSNHLVQRPTMLYDIFRSDQNISHSVQPYCTIFPVPIIIPYSPPNLAVQHFLFLSKYLVQRITILYDISFTIFTIRIKISRTKLNHLVRHFLYDIYYMYQNILYNAQPYHTIHSIAHPYQITSYNAQPRCTTSPESIKISRTTPNDAVQRSSHLTLYPTLYFIFTPVFFLFFIFTFPIYLFIFPIFTKTSCTTPSPAVRHFLYLLKYLI